MATPDRTVRQRLRAALALAADLAQVGAVVLAGGVVAHWVLTANVRAWKVAAVLIPFAVLVGALLIRASVLIRRARQLPSAASATRTVDVRGESALARRVNVLEQESFVAANYLKNIGNFFALARGALATLAEDPDLALARLSNIRLTVFHALAEGATGTRGQRTRVAYFRALDENGETYLATHEGYHIGHTHRVEMRRLRLDSFAGRVFATGTPAYCDDTLADDAHLQWFGNRDRDAKEMRSLFCAPGFGREPGMPAKGVLCVSSSPADAFSEADRDFAAVCANIMPLLDYFQTVARDIKAIPGPPLHLPSIEPLESSD